MTSFFYIPGHRRLSEIGILHRDISPGNIYLWDIEGNGRAPSAGNEGFIADLELASVPQTATTFIAVPVTPDVPEKRTQAGSYLIPIPSNAPQSPPPRAATPQRMVFKSRPVPPKSDPGPSFTVSCCLNIYRNLFISYYHREQLNSSLRKSLMVSFRRGKLHGMFTTIWNHSCLSSSIPSIDASPRFTQMI
jgi:Fungal protein kinase